MDNSTEFGQALPYSDTLFDDLSLDMFRIVDQVVEVVDIADEVLPHFGQQPFLLINECID